MRRKMPESVKRELSMRRNGRKMMRKHPITCKAKFPEVKCSFSNQSIKPPVRYKPHICIRQGWWRVSPLNVKPGVEVAEQRWRKAHDFACKANEPTRQTLYARINDDEQG